MVISKCFYYIVCKSVCHAPKAKKMRKTLKNKGFLFKRTLFDRWFPAKNKGEWRKLFAFAVFCALE